MTEQANRVMPILRWRKQKSAKGSIGTNLDVTPDTSNNTIFEMYVNSPFFEPDTTLKIYNDSIAAGNLIFDGYIADRDADGKVIIQENRICTTKWIVVTSGGSGDLFAMARYD